MNRIRFKNRLDLLQWNSFEEHKKSSKSTINKNKLRYFKKKKYNITHIYPKVDLQSFIKFRNQGYYTLLIMIWVPKENSRNLLNQIY